MAVRQTWKEEHDEQTTLVGYIVDGPTDSAGVAAALLGAIPTLYDWRVLNRIQSVRLFPGYTDHWECVVKYAAFQEKRELQAGDMEFRFETQSVQSTRTVSISSRVFGSGGIMGTPPEDARIIGWNPNNGGSAKGATVEERAYSFSWTVIVPFTTATESWRKSAGELVTTVNSGTFFGYAAGEVKFDAITGSVRGAEDYRFDLRFSRRPNIASLDVGGITCTNTKGWELIDADMQKWIVPTSGDNKGFRIPVVSRVKVHQIYTEASWSVLSSLLGV